MEKFEAIFRKKSRLFKKEKIEQNFREMGDISEKIWEEIKKNRGLRMLTTIKRKLGKWIRRQG